MKKKASKNVHLVHMIFFPFYLYSINSQVISVHITQLRKDPTSQPCPIFLIQKFKKKRQQWYTFLVRCKDATNFITSED